MRGVLRMLGDSSLPRPHHTPSAHIGTALFHARTATTGTDVILPLVVAAVLIVLGLAFLVAYRRLAR